MTFFSYVILLYYVYIKNLTKSAVLQKKEEFTNRRAAHSVVCMYIFLL